MVGAVYVAAVVLLLYPAAGEGTCDKLLSCIKSEIRSR